MQRAQYAITANQVTMTASVCTALANTGPYALGRGSFRYGSATASPVGCSYSGTPCDTCTLEVAGTVGATGGFLYPRPA